MAQLTRAQLLSKYNGIFADNITREISEADLREFVTDVKDSFINILDYVAPSASFASLTGEPLDNPKLHEFQTNIINALRGGVDVNFNTLKKLYDLIIANRNLINGGTAGTPISIIRLRRDNDTNWTTRNPILQEGEIGINTTFRRVKIGNGVLPWNSMPYAFIPSEIDGGAPSGNNATLTTIVRLKRGTSTQWTSANPVLGLGEMALETNTRKIKVGDGTNNYNNLSYWFDNSGTQAFKGFHTTPTALNTAFPTATIGDYAIVGSTDTVWIWDADTTAWINSGEVQPTIGIDAVPTDGSANAVSSNGVFDALATQNATISTLVPKSTTVNNKPLTGDIILTQEDIGITKKWVPVTPSGSNITFDVQNKNEAFFRYTANGNYVYILDNVSAVSDDVVEITFKVTFGAGQNSHIVTLPSAYTNLDEEGLTISSITLTSSANRIENIYAIKDGSVLQWFWNQSGTINGGTP